MGIRRYVLALALLILGGVAYAGRISEADAIGIVQRQMDKSSKAGASLRRGSLSLAEHADRNYYVVNDNANGGYYFVSASDRVENMVLGHAVSGHYDERVIERIPALKAMLSAFSQHIGKLESSPNTLRSSSDGETICYGDDIKPLIKTAWGQKFPYNLLAPEGTATGCVATAMSQILNYYAYPSSFSGELPSYSSYDSVMPPLPKTSFDYSKIKEKYDTTAGSKTDSDESKAEVAKLMQYCGRSVQMQYAESSGAHIYTACEALQRHFGFSNKMSHVLGYDQFLYDSYSEESWNRMLYNELRQKRPVLMSLKSLYEGHAYLCCGYSADEGFYYNFGFDGEGDGYYRSESKYLEGLFYRSAIIGIEPRRTERINGLDIEVSDMKISSSFVKMDMATIELKVKNHSQEEFSDYFLLSSNEFANNIMSNTLTLKQGEEGTIRFDYGIMGSHKDLKLDVISSDCLLVRDTVIELGKYNHDYSSIVCEIEDNYGLLNNSFSDVPPFPKRHGDGNLRIVVKIYNNSDTTFRDIVERRQAYGDTTYIDTLRYNDETYMEIAPHGMVGRFMYLVHREEENRCPVSRFMVGNALHTMAEYYFEDCFELEYKDFQGESEVMDPNSVKVPSEASCVNLMGYLIDSLNTTDANPNCLYLTDREGYKPYGVTHNLVVNGVSDSINISGNHPFLSEKEIKASVAEFRKDFDKDVTKWESVTLRGGRDDEYNWTCMIFPFSPSSALLEDGTEVMRSDKLRVYSFSERLEVVPSDEIKPHVPYLIGAMGSSVRFKAWDVTIPASKKVEQKTDFGSLVSASVPYSCMEQFDYSITYTFNPTARSFERDILSMFDECAPFSVTLMNDDFLGEDTYPIDMSTGLYDAVSNDEEKFILYTPLGVSQGEYRMQNGEIEGLDQKGVYISKGLKIMKR